MPGNRVFLPQESLDRWLDEGRIEMSGETMILRPEGQSFHLQTALYFLAEVASGEDGLSLVGKVKDLQQLEAFGGEHCADSVLIGEHAYQIVEGFVGEPIRQSDNMIASGSSLAEATRAAIGDSPSSTEIDQLAQFFLSG